jgi:hypothetical protein
MAMISWGSCTAWHSMLVIVLANYKAFVCQAQLPARFSQSQDMYG